MTPPIQQQRRRRQQGRQAPGAVPPTRQGEQGHRVNQVVEHRGLPEADGLPLLQQALQRMGAQGPQDHSGHAQQSGEKI